MEAMWQALREPVLEYTTRALVAALILVLGWLAVQLVVGPLQRLLGRSRIDPAVSSFLTNLTRSVFLIVVILGVLQELGVHTASLVAVLGAAGLAVALSLQGSMANFASGLIILAFRLVRLGDVVETGDIRGRVAEMLPFHVILITADNQRVTVPNTVLTNAPVRNHSVLPTRRAQWNLPLTPRDDLAAVKEALLAKLRTERRILAEPAPQLFIQEWAEDKRVLAIQAWTVTADHGDVQQGLLEILGMELDRLRQGQVGR